MKRLLLAALLALCTSSAWADWGDVGTIMNANNGSAGTSWAPVTSAALEAGNVGACMIAADETGTATSGGDCNQFTTVTDAAGNTWNQVKEWCNQRTATAADGAKLALYVTVATSTLSSGAAITFNFSASTTAKAVTCMEFTHASGGTTAYVGSPGVNIVGSAVDPDTLTYTTLGIRRQYLFLRGTAAETNVTTYTVTSGWVVFAGQGANSVSNSGTALTSIGVMAEYRIATEDPSIASDPTYTAADYSSFMVAFIEDPRCGTSIATTGLGCPI